MGSEDLSAKAKQTLKSVKELLEKAEESTQKALEKAAPKVQKSVDDSMDSAAKGFTSTMKAIDGATAREQLGVLKAYRRFINGQGEFVDSRIKVLEDKAKSKHDQAA